MDLINPRSFCLLCVALRQIVRRHFSLEASHGLAYLTFSTYIFDIRDGLPLFSGNLITYASSLLNARPSPLYVEQSCRHHRCSSHLFIVHLIAQHGPA